MTRRDLYECFGVFFVFVIVLTFAIKAITMNEDSYDSEASSIVYSINSHVANLRAGPGVGYKVKGQMESGDVVQLSKRKGDWFKGIHLKTNKEGWISKSTMKRYLYLKYYDSMVIGKSTLELQWD